MYGSRQLVEERPPHEGGSGNALYGLSQSSEEVFTLLLSNTKEKERVIKIFTSHTRKRIQLAVVLTDVVNLA